MLADLIPADLKDTDTVRRSEVARMLGVSSHTIRLWSEKGQLPSVKKLGTRTHVMVVGELRKSLRRLDTESQEGK